MIDSVCSDKLENLSGWEEKIGTEVRKARINDGSCDEVEDRGTQLLGGVGFGTRPGLMSRVAHVMGLLYSARLAG